MVQWPITDSAPVACTLQQRFLFCSKIMFMDVQHIGRSRHNPGFESCLWVGFGHESILIKVDDFGYMITKNISSNTDDI